MSSGERVLAPEPAPEDDRLSRLRAEAEAEMRRRLPDQGGRAAKRQKGDGGGGGGGGGSEAGAEAATGGRFDYGAVQELPTGLAGFLLTCPLQRESSARKEAVPLLQRHLAAAAGRAAAPLPGSEEAAAAAAPAAGAAAAAAPAAPAPAPAAGAQPAPQQQQQVHLAPIKLACRGVTLFKLASDAHQGDAAARLATAAAAALVGDVESGAQARLAHVQRVMPVQTTCALEAGALAEAGGRLAALVAAAERAEACAEQSDGGGGSPAAGQLTFGIAVKQRVLEVAGQKAAAAQAGPCAEGEAAAGGAPAGGSVSGAPASLDRGAIISALAGGFEGALRRQHGLAAAVDLKNPAYVLVVEAVPAGGALYAALAALPRRLCVLKPKLHIRAVGRGGGGGGA